MNLPRAIGFGCGMFAVSVGLSFVHPWGDLRDAAPKVPMLGTGEAPSEVRAILENKCADCHSNRTQWPFYSTLAPSSWLLEHDVHEGRGAMNLSLWDQMSSAGRISILTRLAAKVRSGEMPPSPYAMAHPAKRLTDDDKQLLGSWAKAERRRIRTIGDDRKGTEKP